MAQLNCSHCHSSIRMPADEASAFAECTQCGSVVASSCSGDAETNEQLEPAADWAQYDGELALVLLDSDAAQSNEERCPACNSLLINDVRVCVKCGYDLEAAERQEPPPVLSRRITGAMYVLAAAAFVGCGVLAFFEIRKMAAEFAEKQRQIAETQGYFENIDRLVVELEAYRFKLSTGTPGDAALVAAAKAGLPGEVILDEMAARGPRTSEGRILVREDAVFEAATRVVAEKLPYLPRYIAKIETHDSPKAEKKKGWIQFLIERLPADTELSPLREIPQDSFAYDAAQTRLASPPPEPERVRYEDSDGIVQSGKHMVKQKDGSYHAYEVAVWN